ncbi:MAG TPA: acyl-CoA dehydrogenase family protein [Candidatus Nanopelagicales bacterium]|nr:acyl-CoA dehydrogenase family protein [Candidatus Nanopelagicales bacterium]
MEQTDAVPAGSTAATNQPPPLIDHDAFRADLALPAAVARYSPAADAHLGELGELAGAAAWLARGTEANRDLPRLRTHDRYGNRVDEVEFGPAWHDLLGAAVSHGLHAAPWRTAEPGAHAARAAGFVLWTGVEAGHGCPVSMTYAAVPALRTDPDLAAAWEPGLTAPRYDPGLRPPAMKSGLLAGMGMTEKQGGSDVRSTTTVAVPVDGGYLLTGHKWFCSAPMSDVFLVLAQAPAGLTCFVLPRVLPDGSRNGVALIRLKDKLGNRSNASAEIELTGAFASRLGEEGRGVATIARMVSATRLDCVLGSTGLQRRALHEALWHARHRAAFGQTLVDQPLMASVLGDLVVEWESSLAVAMRLAATFDSTEAAEAGLRRLALPAAKYTICKRSPFAIGEALECLGGNGYVEDSGMPRLYREAPVNSVWEGSGSVTALDLVRALTREPDSLAAYLTEIGQADGMDPRLDAAVTDLLTSLADTRGLESRARRLAEQVTAVLAGSLLVRHGDPAVAETYCATRLAGDRATTFGTLPRGSDTGALLDRVPLGRDG